VAIKKGRAKNKDSDLFSIKGGGTRGSKRVRVEKRVNICPMQKTPFEEATCERKGYKAV